MTRLEPAALRDLFEAEGGRLAPCDYAGADQDHFFPSFAAPVLTTASGTPYLRDAGAALIARPSVHLDAARDFLAGLGDAEYLEDRSAPLGDAVELVKFAGQACYLSFGPDRSRNVDAPRYLDNIKRSRHGSVLEHATFTVLLWGISRNLTHELVRHRHKGYSQVSQRYVPPRRVRFVEAYEYQGEHRANEHGRFCGWIDHCREEYEAREAQALVREFPHRWGGVDGKTCNACDYVHSRSIDCAACGGQGYDYDPGSGRRSPCEAGEACEGGKVYPPLGACPVAVKEAGTDGRKRVRQAARRCLPGETEAPIVVSGNVRAWRNTIDQRVNRHADVEIRRAFYRVLLMLAAAEPLLWEDYSVERLPDGTSEASTPYVKV